MKRFSPGPLTYLLPKSSLVPEIITAGNVRVAVRIPDHPLTLRLLELLDFPIAAPSANPSGYVSPVSANHVLDGLEGKIPYILDGGVCRVGLESTILGFENDFAVIHRLGTVTAEEISSGSQVKVNISLSHSAPSAPGQLKSHYATRTPLICGDIAHLLGKFEGQKIGVLSFTQTYLRGVQKNIVLSKAGKLEEAAANLFMAMRELDALCLDIIVTEAFPDEGVGIAINDRLARAAYKGESE
jgi:L-threonylcarbamoyladenylate synthase